MFMYNVHVRIQMIVVHFVLYFFRDKTCSVIKLAATTKDKNINIPIIISIK